MATVGIPHPPPGPPPPLPRRFIRRRFIKPLDTRPAPVPGLWQPKDSKPNKPPKLGTDTKHTAKSRARATFLGGERAKFDARFPPLGKDTDPARADVGKTTPEQPNFEERALYSGVTRDHPPGVLEPHPQLAPHPDQQLFTERALSYSDITRGSHSGVFSGVRHHSLQPDQHRFPERVHSLRIGQPHCIPEQHQWALQQRDGVGRVLHCPVAYVQEDCHGTLLHVHPHCPREQCHLQEDAATVLAARGDEEYARCRTERETYANVLEQIKTIVQDYEAFLANHPEQLSKVTLRKSVDVKEAEKARLSGDTRREFDIYTQHLNDLTYNKAVVVTQLNKEERERKNAEQKEVNEQDDVVIERKVQLLSKIIDEKYPPDEDKGEEEYDDDGDRLMEEESEEEEVDEETDEFSEDDDNCDDSGKNIGRCAAPSSLQIVDNAALNSDDENQGTRSHEQPLKEEHNFVDEEGQRDRDDMFGEEGNEQSGYEEDEFSEDNCEDSGMDISRCITPCIPPTTQNTDAGIPCTDDGNQETNHPSDGECGMSLQSREKLLKELDDIADGVEQEVLGNLAKLGRLMCLESAFNGRDNSEMMDMITSLEKVIETTDKDTVSDDALIHECEADLVKESSMTEPSETERDEDDPSDKKSDEQPDSVVHREPTEPAHDKTTEDAIDDGMQQSGPSLALLTPSQKADLVNESGMTEPSETEGDDNNSSDNKIIVQPDLVTHSEPTEPAHNEGKKQSGPSLPASIPGCCQKADSVKEIAMTKAPQTDPNHDEQPHLDSELSEPADETAGFDDGKKQSGLSLPASPLGKNDQKTDLIKESTTAELLQTFSNHDRVAKSEPTEPALDETDSMINDAEEQTSPILPASNSTSSNDAIDDKTEKNGAMFMSNTNSVDSKGDGGEQSGPFLPAFMSTSISTSSTDSKGDEGERGRPILRAFTSTSISTSSAESRATHNAVTSSSSPQRKRQRDLPSLKPKQTDNKPAKGDATEYRKKVSFPQEKGGKPVNHRSNLTFYAKMHPNELGELISSALVSDIMAYASASGKEVPGDSDDSSIIAVKYMSVMTTEKNATTLQPVFAGKNGGKQSTLAFTISGEMLLSSDTSEVSNTVETQLEERGEGPSVSFEMVIPSAQSESSNTVKENLEACADGTNVGTNTPTSEGGGLKSADHSSGKTGSSGHVLGSTNDEVQANNENPCSCSLSCKTSSQPSSSAGECIAATETDKNVSERAEAESVMLHTEDKESVSPDTDKHTALLESNGLQLHFDVSAMCSAMCKAIPHVLNQMAIETAANGSVTLDRAAFTSTKETKSPVDTVIRKPTSPEDQNTHSDVGTTSKKEAADPPPYTYRLITPSAFDTTPELLKDMTNCPGATKSDGLPTFMERVTMDHKYQGATMSDTDTTLTTSTGPQNTEMTAVTSTSEKTETVDSKHTLNSGEKTECALVPFDSQILTLKAFNTTAPYESGTVGGTEGGAKESIKRPLVSFEPQIVTLETLDAAAKWATSSESDVENRGYEIDTENAERALVPFDSQLITLKAFDTTAKQGTFNDLTASQEHVEVDMSTVADREQITIIGGGDDLETDGHVMNYTTDAGVCKDSKTLASLRRADLEEAVNPPDKCSQAEKLDFRQTKSIPPEMECVLSYSNVVASKVGVEYTTDASVCKDSKTLASFRRADLEEAVNEPVKHSKVKEVNYHRAKSWPRVFPMESRPALLPKRAKMNQNTFQTSKTHTAVSGPLKATRRAVKKQESHCSTDCVKGTETTNGSQKHQGGYSHKSSLLSSGHNIAAPGLAQQLYKSKSLPIKLREAGHCLTRHMRKSQSDSASAVPRLPKLV